MSAGMKWILAIVGLLTANLVAMAILIGAAHAGGSRVLPQYYERAIHYDDAIDQAAKNRALGWRASARFVGREPIVTVVDREGAPIRDVSVVATPRAAGVHPAGIYDLTVTAVRGGERFVEHVVAEAR